MNIKDVVTMVVYIAITFILSSVGSQILKKFFNFVTTRQFDLKKFTQDGGFPSSHSAFSVSMGIIAIFFSIWAIKNNFSYEFCALTLIVTFVAINHICIVIRDALGVRRSVGKLADALQKLNKTNKETLTLIEQDNNVTQRIQENFEEIAKLTKIKSGHLPHEVIGGIFWGILASTTTSVCYYGYSKLFILCLIGIVVYIVVMSIFLRYGSKIISLLNNFTK